MEKAGFEGKPQISNLQVVIISQNTGQMYKKIISVWLEGHLPNLKNKTRF